MKLVFITSDIPYFILYHKLEQIDPRLNEYYPFATDVEIDLRAQITKTFREFESINLTRTGMNYKRFLALIKRNEKLLKQHFHVEEYQYDDNERYSVFINLTEDELNAYLQHKAYCHLNNRLMSESLFKSIKEAIYDLNKVESRRKAALFSQLAYQAHTAYTQNETRCYTLNTQGKLTFLKTGRICHINTNDKWTTTNRSEVKIGRGLRNILNRSLIKYTDNEIEQIHNHLVAQYTFGGTFEVVTGEKIREYYLYESYASHQGSLNQSCMKYQECQTYLEFYIANPDKVSLLVAKRDGYIIGRALLWKPDNCSEIIMDRIYGNDVTIDAFKKYAQERRYVYKEYQNHSSTNEFISNLKPCYEVTMEMTPEVPYMDTFRYYNYPDGDTITLSSESGDYALSNTDGRYGHDDDEDYITLDNGQRVHEDEAAYSSWIDGYIHQDDAVWSEYHDTYLHEDWEYTEINGMPVMIEDDNVVYDEYNEQYIFRDDAKYLSESGTYIQHDEAVFAINRTGNVVYEAESQAQQCEYSSDYLRENGINFYSITEDPHIEISDDAISLRITREADSDSGLAYLRYRYTFIVTENNVNNES